MTGRAAYLDASALVKLVSDEAESAALASYLEGVAHRASSRISIVEVSRALARKRSSLVAEIEGVLARLEFVELDAALARAAADVMPPALRSLDAIHLASALTVRDALDVVVTYDQRLADAARAAGLEVVSPS